MATWKDVTSYTKSGSRVPLSWQLQVTDYLSIVLTNWHRDYKGQWVMHCAPWYDTYLLSDATSASEAQKIALCKVKAEVHELLQALLLQH